MLIIAVVHWVYSWVWLLIIFLPWQLQKHLLELWKRVNPHRLGFQRLLEQSLQVLCRMYILSWGKVASLYFWEEIKRNGIDCILSGLSWPNNKRIRGRFLWHLLWIMFDSLWLLGRHICIWWGTLKIRMNNYNLVLAKNCTVSIGKTKCNAQMQVQGTIKFWYSTNSLWRGNIILNKWWWEN